MSSRFLLSLAALSFTLSLGHADEQFTKAACAPLNELRRQEHADAWRKHPEGLTGRDLSRKYAFDLASDFFNSSSRMLLHTRPNEWVTDDTVESMVRIRAATLGRISVKAVKGEGKRSYEISPIVIESRPYTVLIDPNDEDFNVTVCGETHPVDCVHVHTGKNAADYYASREASRQAAFGELAPLTFRNVEDYVDASLPSMCPRRPAAASARKQADLPRGTEKAISELSPDEGASAPKRERACDTGMRPLR